MAITVSKKDVEVLSEALFCYYFAIYKKNKFKKYSISDWLNINNQGDLNKWSSNLGINSITKKVNSDSAFISRLDKVYTFLTEKGWHPRLVMQMDKFSSSYNINGQCEIMRADEIPAQYDPYKVYEEISKKAKTALGFRGTVDKDKWNPSDVWIFTPKSVNVLKDYVKNLNKRILIDPEYKVGYLNALNNAIFNLYEKKQLYPISLKAPGSSVKITLENAKGISIKKVVRYTQLKYDNNNQDAKIGFAVDLFNETTRGTIKKDYIVGNIKTKTVPSGGARLEIEVKGGGARYGTMGTENYQYIISETDNSGIQSLDKIRTNLERSNPVLRKYWSGSSGRNWLARKKLLESFKKDPVQFKNEIEPYTQALYKHLNGTFWDPSNAERGARSPEEAWLNKTHAGEVGVAVNDIANKISRDITVENLFDLAASQRFGAGISAQQLERRKQMLPNSLREINNVPVTEAKTIWNACFHLVVK
mgnify:FL=1